MAPTGGLAPPAVFSEWIKTPANITNEQEWKCSFTSHFLIFFNTHAPHKLFFLVFLCHWTSWLFSSLPASLSVLVLKLSWTHSTHQLLVENNRTSDWRLAPCSSSSYRNVEATVSSIHLTAAGDFPTGALFFSNGYHVLLLPLKHSTGVFF